MKVELKPIPAPPPQEVVITVSRDQAEAISALVGMVGRDANTGIGSLYYAINKTLTGDSFKWPRYKAVSDGGGTNLEVR